MERKKRNLMVVLIAAVIVVAILASFGLRLFVPDTAKIVLPTPAASASPGLEPGTGSGLVRVDVTPETVQTVIGQTLTGRRATSGRSPSRTSGVMGSRAAPPPGYGWTAAGP